MTERRTGSDTNVFVREEELPSDWREREHTAVERLFEAVGRRPTEAELTKVEEIVDAAEQWKARRAGGSDSTR